MSCNVTSNDIYGDIVKDIEKTEHTPIIKHGNVSLDSSDNFHDYPDVVGFIQSMDGVIFDGEDSFSSFAEGFIKALTQNNSRMLKIIAPELPHSHFPKASKAFATRFIFNTADNATENVSREISQGNIDVTLESAAQEASPDMEMDADTNTTTPPPVNSPDTPKAADETAIYAVTVEENGVFSLWLLKLEKHNDGIFVSEFSKVGE